MYNEKRIVYQKPTTIKFWNLYDDDIFSYFMKRFSSYLSEIGLSCNQMGSPREHFEVKNPQSTKRNEFLILGMDNWFYPKNPNPKIHEHYLNFDLNHLLFFNIADKEKELNVLSEFNEILKIKNESNENLEINERNESNISFYLNPSFFLILYDSTNESGNFHPLEKSPIILPSYSDLNIIEHKHFDIQGFYEWLYNSTDRESRVIKKEINQKFLKSIINQQKKSPAYDINIIVAHIARYKTDNSLNINDKSRLSKILNYFSMSELKKMGKELQLTKFPMRKDQLINILVELSDQANSRDSIMRICMDFLRIHVETLRSSKKSMAQIEKNAKKFSEILKPR